jgi:hypothetical protein
MFFWKQFRDDNQQDEGHKGQNDIKPPGLVTESPGKPGFEAWAFKYGYLPDGSMLSRTSWTRDRS